MTEQKKERLAKFIAASGHCSRRKAEELIAQGLVTINGRTVEGPVTLVDGSEDIEVDGKKIEKIIHSRIWILNKPMGYVCTTSDEKGRPTIYDLLPPALKNLHYIGRLDMNSEGLLLLTNSPEVKLFYEHPSNKIPREYLVRIFGEIPNKIFTQSKKGIAIKDRETGKNMVYHADIELHKANEGTGKNNWLKFTLREGKNREIRRICEHYGLQVSKLRRTSFGEFRLGSLEHGKFFEV